MTIPRFRRAIGLAVAIASTMAIGDAVAQSTNASKSAPLAIGETFTLRSRVLSEVRRINVYVPPVYTDSPRVHLPVLYMPDGGMAEDFLHVAGLVQVSTGNGTMRPFILVGIENTERRRDLTGPTDVASDKKIAPRVGASAAFRDFIRTELKPEIAQRFRTTSESGIVGESLAGLFVVETFLREPSLFDTYIAIDPSLWWNGGTLVNSAAGEIAAVARAKGGAVDGKKTLWYATSSEGSTELAARFAEELKARAGASVVWHYEPMPEETHATIYHPAALRAFRQALKPPT